MWFAGWAYNDGDDVKGASRIGVRETSRTKVSPVVRRFVQLWFAEAAAACVAAIVASTGCEKEAPPPSTIHQETAQSGSQGQQNPEATPQPSSTKVESKTPVDFKLAFTKAAVANNGMLATALKMYRVHMGHYPTDEEGGLKALIEKPSDEDASKKWAGPYVEKATDLKDVWNNAYIYRFPGKHNPDGFDLYSCGPDGRADSNDDIGNW